MLGRFQAGMVDIVIAGYLAAEPVEQKAAFFVQPGRLVATVAFEH